MKQYGLFRYSSDQELKNMNKASSIYKKNYKERYIDILVAGKIQFLIKGNSVQKFGIYEYVHSLNFFW